MSAAGDNPRSRLEASEAGGVGLTVALPAELVDAIADQVLERIADRLPGGDDGWLRGADQIAAYIGAPVSRVYSLAACNPPRIPVERDGSNLVAKRSGLDAWVRRGGGIRP